MSEANHRRIIIGDVHGHYEGLMTLMEAISPGAGDQVYFLGDLIDRGPDSAHVVNFVKQSSYPCLLGNHEQLMLEAIPGVRSYSPLCRHGSIVAGKQRLPAMGMLEFCWSTSSGSRACQCIWIWATSG